MADLLDMNRINALPLPLFVRELGSDHWWPVHDIEVQTGLMRIDVCGLLDVTRFIMQAEIKDGNGKLHDPEDFYNEQQEGGDA